MRIGVGRHHRDPSRGRAQSSASAPRIGFLNNLNQETAAASTNAFQQGLRDLGGIDGKNIFIEYRWANGDMTRHAALVSDLLEQRVVLIVTAGTQAVSAARQATSTVPIVVAIMPDPVVLGFARSLARPGGNVTGLANLFEELTPKQLQILKELIPAAKRVALLSDRSRQDGIQSKTEAAARAIGLVPQVYYAKEPGDLDTAIKSAKSERAEGLLVLPSPSFNRNRARIAEIASRHGLPTFSESSEYVRDGGLLSYVPSFPQMYYRTATYVDRILKGEKPGDLPIERPTKFELVVNLKTAKALGIAVPQALMLRADEVVQ